MNSDNRKILVAPLNWGLGHATRCIPIIKGLIKAGYAPIIASDGDALLLLQKEFPELKSYNLPSYNITYPKKGHYFKYKLLKDSPHVLRTIKKENKIIRDIVARENIKGIISDNRFGVRHDAIPSVFMTHQICVLSGNTTWLSTKFHQHIISKFDECWVPDFKHKFNLSGKLGHTDNFDFPVKYIGPLSRFQKIKVKRKYDLLVLLSGPEPQRSLLGEKLLQELESFTGKVCFVKGTVEPEQTYEQRGRITHYNFLTSKELETVINDSHIVLSRSGYTTIMDLAKLGKKAFFIPTPGQFEQEYLAEKLNKEGIVPSCTQEQFSVDKLNSVKEFKGFSDFDFETDLGGLFDLFEREGKLTSHA